MNAKAVTRDVAQLWGLNKQVCQEQSRRVSVNGTESIRGARVCGQIAVTRNNAQKQCSTVSLIASFYHEVYNSLRASSVNLMPTESPVVKITVIPYSFVSCAIYILETEMYC